MARKPNPEPTYYPSKGGYYVQLRKKKHCLAKGPEDDPEVKAEAQRNFHALMSGELVLKAGDRQPCYGILNEYAAWVQDNLKGATFDIKKRYLELFSQEFGVVAVRDLTPLHVERLIQKYKEPHKDRRGRVYTWGEASRQACITTLVACFSWAARMKIISENPLAGGLKSKMSRSRGREALISEEDHQKLLSVASEPMRDLLTALNGTGARPGAIYCVEAKDLNEKRTAWVGTERKRERFNFPGIIYLQPEMVELHDRLALKHPEGPIFRNRTGGPWNDASVERWFGRWRDRLGLNPKICPYSYRHKFATQWLINGGSMAYLAELQNTSVRMIEHHYGHLREHGTQLRETLIEVMGRSNKNTAGAQGGASSAVG